MWPRGCSLVLFLGAIQASPVAAQTVPSTRSPRGLPSIPPALTRSILRVRAIGCYRILPSGAELVPAGIQLDTTMLWSFPPPGGTDRRAILLAPDGRALSPPPREIQWPRWSADSLTDSVRIKLYTGFGGITFTLSLADSAFTDSLPAAAVRSHDFGPPFDDPPTPALLVRFRCRP
jgi:hypothetical protein